MAMTFEEATMAAAKAADRAAKRAMRKYASGHVTDEDDITGVLAGNLDADLDGTIGGLQWSTSVVRHRKGIAAEERTVGADLVIHVKLDTPTQKYSKGVLIQAKRVDKNELMSRANHSELVSQCRRMIGISPASYVFDYAKGRMRCGAATKLAGSTRRDLYDACGWTSYRFFLELFRCPVGDPRLTSALVRDFPIPTEISITANGELRSE